ncbi:MAG TPA: histidine kinase [Rhizobiales bacterium]|nr:histidine kinase [Hyphomicrobiales bacterium]
MSLRLKIVLLAALPLVLAMLAIGGLIMEQSKNLSARQIATLERSLLEAKKAELRYYIALALNSIEHIYRHAGPDDEAAKRRARVILNDLSYGPDGYFFVYDYDGNNLVHPRQSFRVGKNWWKLKDAEGNLVIQNLIAQAKKGGGYTRYMWERPSASSLSEKIGYAVGLDKWRWMIGTGLYLDDISARVDALKSEVTGQIRQVFILIFILSVLAVSAVFAMGVYLALRENRQAAKSQKMLTRRIVEAQEEERSRVARELHDGISQNLSSVKYTLELAGILLSKNAEGVLPALEKGTTGVTRAIREVRRISRDLRPGMLDDLGLLPSLHSLAADFSERTGIKVEIDAQKLVREMPRGFRTTLFRVAQESLMNIERHSGASRVSLKLETTKTRIRMTIADDGHGFDVENIRKSPGAGIGLKNMRERLAYIGGHLKLSSTAEGTFVKAELPISRGEQRPGRGDERQTENQDPAG